MSKKNIPLKIVKLLIKEDEPLILQHIAKKINETPQATGYNIRKMCEKGILVSVFDETDNNKLYHLQSFYYMDETLTSLYILLEPFGVSIADLIEIKDCRDKVTALANNLEIVFQLFVDSIRE